MFYTIIDKSNLLKYQSSDNLFAGLVVMDENSIDIFDSYQDYIELILKYYVGTILRDEQNIESDIKNLCSERINLPADELSEILSVFSSFFLYDKNSQQLLIKRNVLLKTTDGRDVITTSDGNYQLVEFKRESPQLKEMDISDKPLDEDDTEELNEDVLTPDKGDDTNTNNEKSEFEKSEDVIDNKNKKIHINKTYLRIAVVIMIIFGFVLYAYNNWPLMTENYDNDSDTLVNQETAIINFNVIDSLQTDGKLIICEDSSIVIKYFISSNTNLKDQNIKWDECEFIAPGTTLFPKEKCAIFLRAELKQSPSQGYDMKTYLFDLCAFVEELIKTPSNESLLNQLFNYAKNRPLTIEYNNTVEDICSTSIDKGNLDNLRQNLIDGNYHIDSISFYETNCSKFEELLSNKYSSIKYISCKAISQ